MKRRRSEDDGKPVAKYRHREYSEYHFHSSRDLAITLRNRRGRDPRSLDRTTFAAKRDARDRSILAASSERAERDVTFRRGACTRCVVKALNWAGGPRVTAGRGPVVGDVYMLDIRVITPPLFLR
jgi:hypothetical protein